MVNPEIRVFIDETRHLKNNPSPMVLGCIWGTMEDCAKFNKKIKLVKIKHEIPIQQELKWTKVGSKKIDYYKDILLTFLEDPKINYRGIVINKFLINYNQHNLTADDFYYRMQYLVIRNIVHLANANYRLFFDYKDTWSSHRANCTVQFLKSTKKLSDNNFTAQPLRSDEVNLIQIADFLNGLLAYANSDKDKQKSKAKKELVHDLEENLKISLSKTSPNAQEKFNILIWQPKKD